jgi:hypothetical protein
MQLSDHQLGSGGIPEWLSLGVRPLRQRRLTSQPRAKRGTSAALGCRVKKGQPCKGATDRGDLCHARFGAEGFRISDPGRCPGLACQRPLAYAEELSPNGGSSQAVDFGESTCHDTVPLPQLLIFNCIVTAERRPELIEGRSRFERSVKASRRLPEGPRLESRATIPL